MHFMQNHIVYLKEMWCSCGMFQLVGYPCCHAIAAIDYHRLKMEDFIDECFKKEVYLKVYSHMIHPVPGMHDFEDSKMGRVEPPDVIIKMGRPKKCRRKDANDVKETASRRGLTHTCTICMKKGTIKEVAPTPHPNSKFNQNQDQRRQGSSTSHGASGSRRSSTPPLPPFDENETIQSEVPPVFSQPSQDSQPKFQFSPKYLLMIHHLQPQETLLRVAGQHQMRLQLEDLMCINHHMNRPFIQRKLLNNLSNNNIHNPQEFIR
ncbi:UNVERIFIED_CONTAM: hypothetical protein Sangu_2952300 [Sesamum angustifolium]|uniref:SWIM-type domain-containing protein n=1 Tax=Sesamum angustifolium TaxID=2727405 RepID=A0AAW2IK77_9LAMI